MLESRHAVEPSRLQRRLSLAPGISSWAGLAVASSALALLAAPASANITKTYVPGVVLPIEVLSDGKATTVDRWLSLDSSAAAPDRIYVQCHRCGFYDAPESSVTPDKLPKAKASMRINGGAWIDIADANVQVEGPESYMVGPKGAINGGAFTVRFDLKLNNPGIPALNRLPADGAVLNLPLADYQAKYLNHIEFRFNGTDGNTNGFRILDVRLMSGTQDVTANRFGWINPLTEKKAVRDAADIATGEMLWKGSKPLNKNGIVSTKIRASCADCHTEGGRDLQYFNYSDNSIVQRSKFHGLAETEGKQIAAYIRAFNNQSGTGDPVVHPDRVPLTHVGQASPWNPPYQPTPGLDNRPTIQWAAGGGLKAVQASDDATMQALFGSTDPTQAQIDAVMQTSRDLNMRQIPIAIQLPDWNAWLPGTHPKDMFAPASGNKDPNAWYPWFPTAYDGNRDLQKIASSAMSTAAAAYKKGAGNWAALDPATRRSVYSAVNYLGASLGATVVNAGSMSYAVRLGSQKLAASSANPAVRAAVDNFGGRCPGVDCPDLLRPFREVVRHDLALWASVRQWELSHTFGLEDQQITFANDMGPTPGVGEKRGWIATDAKSGTFTAAPHISADPDFNHFDWQLDYSQYAPGNPDPYVNMKYSNNPKEVSANYRSIQWYYLSYLLNPGSRLHGQYATGSWHYISPQFDNIWVALNYSKINFPIFAIRTIVNVKAAQQMDNKIPMHVSTMGDWSAARSSFGWTMRALSEDWYGNSPAMLMGLGWTHPLRLRLVNGWVSMLNTAMSKRSPADYRRCISNPAVATDELVSGISSSEITDWYAFCIDRNAPKQKALRPANDPGSPGELQLDVLLGLKNGVATGTRAGFDPVRITEREKQLKRLWPTMDTVLH